MTESIVQRLRETAATLPADRVSMQTLAQAHGPAAHGTWLLLMAVPCLLPVPGVGTVLGLGMVALATAMWQGQSSSCLPQRVAELELSRHWAQRVLGMLASAYSVAGRFAKARLSHLASVERRSSTAAAIGLMALIVVLPIPFGNVLPALALMLIGLGLVFRDGVAVVLGLAMAGLALCVTLGAILLGLSWGSERLPGWLFA
ncbi:exopolysaccharide biosynthesis protein [Methyloversatilis sp.]|uniref:exopolysaccharide biosynthesis protein n=1 Tax=Methyloversatilis sp. TaxID=2569862 RepID=UPI003F720F85